MMMDRLSLSEISFYFSMLADHLGECPLTRLLLGLQFNLMMCVCYDGSLLRSNLRHLEELRSEIRYSYGTKVYEIFCKVMTVGYDELAIR